MTTLVPIRFPDQHTPYHYSYDRMPLEDLATNQGILNSRIDEFEQGLLKYREVGNLSTISTHIPIRDISKFVSLYVTLFSVYDSTNLSSDVVVEDISLFCTVDTLGNVSLKGSPSRVFIKTSAVSVPSLYGITFSVSGDTLVINYSWVTSDKGSVDISVRKITN